MESFFILPEEINCKIRNYVNKFEMDKSIEKNKEILNDIKKIKYKKIFQTVLNEIDGRFVEY